MGRNTTRLVATLAAAALIGTACGSDDDAVDEVDGATQDTTTGEVAELDPGGTSDADAGDTSDDAAGDRASAGNEADEEAAADSGDQLAAPEAEAGATGDADIAGPPPEEEPQGIDPVVFDDHGVAGWIETAAQRGSTFQTDADVASFRIAESWLTSAILPPAEGIRAEEWINALDHEHPAPTAGEVWRVSADAGTPWWETGAESPANTRLVRVGLRAADPGERRPASLTFVIDVSGSMEHDDRLGSVVEVITGFLDQLGPQDQVGVVAFSDDAEVVVEHTNRYGAVKDALASLRPDASTNTGAGTVLGHQQAAAAHRSGDNSSVVVLADGMANEGIVEPELIVDELERVEAPTRIVTHTVGIGREAYNDALLEQLANHSGGTYAYIDGPQHAERLFARDLPLLHPVAHDVKAQVSFDPSTVRSWRLLGYENRTIAAEDFRDDTVTGSYIGAGHEVTAIYELDLQVEGGAGGQLGTVDVRWADPDTGQVSELTSTLDASLATVDATSPTWTSAAGMAALVEALRGSPHALVNLERTAQRLDEAGGTQDRWLAALVRDAAQAFQGASPQRQPSPAP